MDNNIITNMDGIPVIDTATGQFLLEFDSEQQQILKYCIDKGYSIRGFAYSSLPESHMRVILDFYDLRVPTPRKLKDIEIWKAIHTDLNVNQLEEVLFAYTQELDLPDRMDYIKDYPEHVLRLINNAKMRGEDIVDYVQSDECKNFEDLQNYVAKIEEKFEKKQKLKDILY